MGKIFSFLFALVSPCNSQAYDLTQPTQLLVEVTRILNSAHTKGIEIFSQKILLLFITG